MNTDTTLQPAITDLEGYLRTVSDMMAEYNGFRRGPEAFVLDHGRKFETVAPVPEDLKMGRIKECYRNSTHLAWAHPKRFTYCEGFASSIIPVLHAWVVDEEGRVVDTTWRKPGAEYRGIPFKLEFLRESLLKRKVYGLIDAPPHFDLLHMDPVLVKAAIQPVP